MLPELILREEHQENYILLILLGFLSGLLGFAVAKTVFPSQLSILAVVFASIPLVYPLVTFFFEREEEDKYYFPELKVYSSLFAGQVAIFFTLGLFFPETFEIQKEIIGATGHAVAEASFLSIFSNNMFVFTAILGSAALIGSAGAFILTWNASVLGVFFSSLVSEEPLQPLAYLPHASFEMGGFLVAGIVGTVISAAVYREHFDRELWKNILVTLLIGVLFVFIGAVLETA